MSRFTEAAFRFTGETKNGRPIACLTTDLVYEVGFKGSGWEVTAPAGFCTDLASLPAWLARTAMGQRLGGQLVRAAIVHDQLRQDARWPKLLGDYAFWEAMGVDGVALGWRIVCGMAVLINFRRD